MSILKTLVAGLALTNVGYFLWTHGIGGAAAPADTDANAGGATLRIAGEHPAAPRAPSSEVTPTLALAPTSSPHAGSGGDGAANAAAIALRCVSVGPFKDVTDAAHAAATLRGGGYDPRQRGAEGDIWAGIWVFLPIPPNKVAADQMRAKLKAGGIDDALEMPGPNDTPVLSLGLYSEQKRAQGRVAQAQTLGLNPGLADRKRTGNVYWIDIDLKPTDASLNPADLASDTGPHGAHIEVRSCPATGAAP